MARQLRRLSLHITKATLFPLSVSQRRAFSKLRLYDSYNHPIVSKQGDKKLITCSVPFKCVIYMMTFDIDVVTEVHSSKNQ